MGLLSGERPTSADPELPAAEPTLGLADSAAARVWLRTSTFKLMLAALLFGLVVFVVSLLLDWYLLREHESAHLLLEVSDVLAAGLAGALFFLYGRARRREVLRRFETIALMNHHIRNALQVIASSSYLRDRQSEVEAIRDAVNRIQWALREILPKL